MAETFGELLVRLRKARGWTQQQVADAYGKISCTAVKDAREVGRWERGSRIPVPDTRRHLAALFDTPVIVFDQAASASRAKRQAGPVDLRDGQPDVDRRTSLGIEAKSTAVREGTPRRIDPALIPYFQQQLEGHYRADMMLGPLALLDTVEAQCRLIGRLVDEADGVVRPALAQVGVSYATFAAWLHLDAGEPSSALPWHDVAQELAHRARSREAVACALVDRAMARTDQGMGSAVVDLCESALMDAGRLSPEVRVFALQQQAHGASLQGERRTADALLEEAESLLSRVDVEAWGTACLRTPHYVEVQRATCYGRLGLAYEADELWREIIPAASVTARRDAAVWTARQASAAAALKEPERAVALVRQAADAVAETGSVRARRELKAAARAMRPWQAEAVGRELAGVLASIGEGV
ncbi:multiprotein-bridging factor 1 family protein [Streptomyces sp. NPDC059578]|uniref:helix-turn-helix domain-containing protein n=1 Tax=Streptomyces sp. NPDC059578 TaxID=3346874 RepID=UPI0036778F0C